MIIVWDSFSRCFGNFYAENEKIEFSNSYSFPFHLVLFRKHKSNPYSLDYPMRINLANVYWSLYVRIQCRQPLCLHCESSIEIVFFGNEIWNSSPLSINEFIYCFIVKIISISDWLAPSNLKILFNLFFLKWRTGAST